EQRAISERAAQPPLQRLHRRGAGVHLSERKKRPGLMANQVHGLNRDAPGCQDIRIICALPSRFSSGTKPTPGSSAPGRSTDESHPQVSGPVAETGMTGSKRLSRELSRLSPIMK